MVEIDKSGINLYTLTFNKKFQLYPISIKNCFDAYLPPMPPKVEDLPSKGEELHDKWTKLCPGISQEFFEEISAMSERLNFNPEDLCAIMFRESGFKPNAAGKDKKGNPIYYGLIQMDKTALKNAVKHTIETKGKNCGLDPNITLAKYARLPREKQLKYSEAYLKFRIDEKGLTGKKLSGGQLWTLINSPANIKNEKFIARNQRRINNVQKLLSKHETQHTLNRKS